ncbi:hypothetical protein STEG23_014327 [Scotinomys teguina]
MLEPEDGVESYKTMPSMGYGSCTCGLMTAVVTYTRPTQEKGVHHTHSLNYKVKKMLFDYECKNLESNVLLKNFPVTLVCTTTSSCYARRQGSSHLYRDLLQAAEVIQQFKALDAMQRTRVQSPALMPGS